MGSFECITCLLRKGVSPLYNFSPDPSILDMENTISSYTESVYQTKLKPTS